jgi:hypothetical protein
MSRFSRVVIISRHLSGVRRMNERQPKLEREKFFKTFPLSGVDMSIRRPISLRPSDRWNPKTTIYPAATG